MRRRGTAQETFCAQIFINVRPMNPKTAATRLPIGSLLWCGMKKLGIPSQRHRYGASVNEVHPQDVIRAMNIFDPFTWSDV